MKIYLKDFNRYFGRGRYLEIQSFLLVEFLERNSRRVLFPRKH
jgi:hypothetical protein